MKIKIELEPKLKWRKINQSLWVCVTSKRPYKVHKDQVFVRWFLKNNIYKKLQSIRYQS